MTRCRYCHRVLKDVESIARGFGPVCYGRISKKRKRRNGGANSSAEAEESITIEEWYESQKGSVSDESFSHHD